MMIMIVLILYNNSNSYNNSNNSNNNNNNYQYTRSPLEDSRLFGPSPWKILATTYEKRFLSNPAPGENILSGNLVMETGCSLAGDPRLLRLFGRLAAALQECMYVSVYIYHIYT